MGPGLWQQHVMKTYNTCVVHFRILEYVMRVLIRVVRCTLDTPMPKSENLIKRVAEFGVVRWGWPGAETYPLCGNDSWMLGSGCGFVGRGPPQCGPEVKGWQQASWSSWVGWLGLVICVSLGEYIGHERCSLVMTQ